MKSLSKIDFCKKVFSSKTYIFHFKPPCREFLKKNEIDL